MRVDDRERGREVQAKEQRESKMADVVAKKIKGDKMSEGKKREKKKKVSSVIL